MKVFVYGTLKRQHRNHYILETSKYIGTGRTLALCRLFHAGFPVLRPRTKKPSMANLPVLGELYEVTDPDVLARLDLLEGEGRMYHRKVKMIWSDVDRRAVKAYTYVGNGKFWSRFNKGQGLYQPQGLEYAWPATATLEN